MTESALQTLYLPLPEPERPPANAIISPRRLRRVRLAKAPGAMLTIGELAEQLAVEPHVLRFWEAKFPQIKPVKRAGGRRYYRPEDVELIRRIQLMLYRDGFTVRGVQLALEVDAKREGVANDSITIPRASMKKLLDELIQLRAMVDAPGGE